MPKLDPAAYRWGQHHGTEIWNSFERTTPKVKLKVIDVRTLYAREILTRFFVVTKLLKRWWPGTESNRRRRPFQGRALPTELPGRSEEDFAV